MHACNYSVLLSQILPVLLAGSLSIYRMHANRLHQTQTYVCMVHMCCTILHAMLT